MIEILLSPANAPLTTMQLFRIQLHAAVPFEIIPVTTECCIYPMIGAVDIQIDGIHYGLLGGRRDVRLPAVSAARVTPASRVCTLTLRDYTADVLMVTVPTDATAPPFLHTIGQSLVHAVGAETHQREVRELSVPPGYTLHVGETYAQATWSSWPAHATPEEVSRYEEHQEVFFNICSGYALMHLDGRYVTGEEARGVVKIENNTALVTPLGAHEVVCSPDGWYWYMWAYQSFLKKEYNTYAHHGVRAYVK